MRGEEGDQEVVNAVEMTNLCVALHCLPGPGGLLDQDHRHVETMVAVLNAQKEREDFDQHKNQNRQPR